jgi:hypothetical protein
MKTPINFEFRTRPIPIAWGVAVPVVFSMLLAGFALSCARGPATEEKPQVLLVAIDGAEWNLIHPLIEKGDLPTFKRVIEGGASGELASLPGKTSPAIWTTIITGKEPEHHGIPGWTIKDADGTVRLVTSNMRRQRTVWEILSDAGLRSTIVGWMATWPATPMNGWLVTSYSPFVTERPGPLDKTANPLKGSIWKEIPRQTYPEDLIDELLPLRVTAPGLTHSQLGRFLERPGETDDPVVAGLVQSLRVGLAGDLTFAAIAEDLLAKKPAEFSAVYFGGIDVVSHRFWRFMDQTYIHASDDEISRFGNVIPEYYRFVDERIDRILERVGPETTLVIISDHGFQGARRVKKRAAELSGVHRPQGVIVLYGKSVRAGASIADATVYDLCPTILALLHQPIARDMSGRVLTEAFDESFPDPVSLGFVETYETGDRLTEGREPVESPVDEQMLEQLRSLGYIQ